MRTRLIVVACAAALTLSLIPKAAAQTDFKSWPRGSSPGEVGKRVAGHVRVAFEVGDSRGATEAAVAGGAELVAEPTETPWRSLNALLEGPGGLQLTLFEELDA